VANPATSAVPARASKALEAGALAATKRKRRYSLLTRRDKILIILMVGIPLTLDFLLIWGPTLSSVLLSFTNWDGINAVTSKNIVGFKNYHTLFTG
jgi:multiple sugar transport system permease protein